MSLVLFKQREAIVGSCLFHLGRGVEKAKAVKALGLTEPRLHAISLTEKAVKPGGEIRVSLPGHRAQDLNEFWDEGSQSAGICFRDAVPFRIASDTRKFGRREHWRRHQHADELFL